MTTKQINHPIYGMGTRITRKKLKYIYCRFIQEGSTFFEWVHFKQLEIL